MSFWYHWCHFWDSSSQSQHVPNLFSHLGTSRQHSRPPEPFHILSQHVTLAHWLNIHFPSYRCCLTGEVRRWEPQMLEKKSVMRKSFPVIVCFSVHQDIFVLVCFLSHSSFIVLSCFSAPQMRFFHGLTSLVLPHFPTTQVDPLSKSLNEMCKVIL